MSEEAPRAAPPVLRKEVVETAALGELVVRMLKLSERLALRRKTASEVAATDADDVFCARLLAVSVLDKEGKPLYSEEQWDIFAAENTADANKLLEAAMRLGGFDGAEAKNA